MIYEKTLFIAKIKASEFASKKPLPLVLWKECGKLYDI